MRLSDKAYRLIRQKIVTLELPPLSAIDEHALMEDLQLGRTPIREALQRLAAEDLVFFAPRRGMFVSDISLTDLQKVFELRVLLEGFCARLAALRATDDQLSEMQALMEQLEKATDGDDKTLLAMDEQFHELLYAASDNEFLAQSLRRLYALSSRLWWLVLARLDNIHGEISVHQGLVRVLRARDESRAEAIMQEHIAGFQNRIRAAI